MKNLFLACKIVLIQFFLLNFTMAKSQKITGYINQLGFVDLGLPSGILWATCNVGAKTPFELGNLYAWGETQPKNFYSWSNYKWASNYVHDKWGRPCDFTKYCSDIKYGIIDNKSILDLIDDAAFVNCGESWRMPTYDELRELYSNCNWEILEKTDSTSVAGCIGISKHNNNSIFFPCDDLDNDVYFYFWSSSLSIDNTNCGSCVYFGENEFVWLRQFRNQGFPVRAVVREYRYIKD